jgi:hypothetical protein
VISDTLRTFLESNKMTNDQDKKQKPNKNDELHIHYGGMTLGSLLRKLRSDKSLDGVRDEILERVTARHAAKSKRELESQQKNNDGNS